MLYLIYAEEGLLTSKIAIQRRQLTFGMCCSNFEVPAGVWAGELGSELAERAGSLFSLILVDGCVSV